MWRVKIGSKFLIFTCKLNVSVSLDHSYFCKTPITERRVTNLTEVKSSDDFEFSMWRSLSLPSQAKNIDQKNGQKRF